MWCMAGADVFFVDSEKFGRGVVGGCLRDLVSITAHLSSSLQEAQSYNITHGSRRGNDAESQTGVKYYPLFWRGKNRHKQYFPPPASTTCQRQAHSFVSVSLASLELEINKLNLNADSFITHPKLLTSLSPTPSG